MNYYIIESKNHATCVYLYIYASKKYKFNI